MGTKEKAMGYDNFEAKVGSDDYQQSVVCWGFILCVFSGSFMVVIYSNYSICVVRFQSHFQVRRGRDLTRLVVTTSVKGEVESLCQLDILRRYRDGSCSMLSRGSGVVNGTSPAYRPAPCMVKPTLLSRSNTKLQVEKQSAHSE
jgi:hypothetical protein